MSLFAQALLDIEDKMAIDLFAGGGGASCGYEQATGRQITVAVNHDRKALEMHKANHPQTIHLRSDVFEVDPRLVCGNRPVGFLWGSPDCTDHSKAKGGKPMRIASKKRRALAHVMFRWGGQVRPDVIMMENVEEFQKWAPLVAAREWITEVHVRADGTEWESRRKAIKKVDGTFAAKGEVVPIDQQLLVRDRRRLGESFRKFIGAFRELGYVVEWRELRACDYGAPTIRNRWYCIARCDGRPIVWPVPTHVDPAKVGATEKEQAAFFKANTHLKPWRTAAECIDWTLPMCSIFATKEEAKVWAKVHGQESPKRPLAENTNRRIARGVMRYVVNNPNPYLVSVAHSDSSPGGVKRWGKGEYEVAKPSKTVAGSKDLALVSPVIGGVGGRAGQSPERGPGTPLGTGTSKADAALFAPILMPITHQGQRAMMVMNRPLSTVTCANRGEMALMVPHLSVLRNSEKPFGSVDDPTQTITAGGANFCLVSGFLAPRYGERQGQNPRCRQLTVPGPAVVCDANGGNLVGLFVSRFRTGATGVSVGRPLDTVTANSFDQSRPGGCVPLGLIGVGISTFYGGPGGANRGADLREPLRVQGTENRFGVWATFLGQNNGGFAVGNSADGRPVESPTATNTNKGAVHSLLGISLGKLRGTSNEADPKAPLHSISANGTHHVLSGAWFDTANNGWDNRSGRSAADPFGAVCAEGSKKALAAVHIERDFGQSVGSDAAEPIGSVTATGFGKAAVVGSFLQKYYGAGGDQPTDSPIHTIPTLDRFGFVTVTLKQKMEVPGPFGFEFYEAGEYYIRDICMRMLQPRELYLAQGFRPDYIIDRGADDKPLTKTDQVHMCGNSVCPPVAEALIRANIPDMIVRTKSTSKKPRKEVALAA